MLTNLINTFEKLVENSTDIDEIVEAILKINKEINKFVYYESKIYQKTKASTRKKNDEIKESITEIFEFADYFMNHFIADEEKDLEEFCTKPDGSYYDFSKNELFEKCIEIWNGFPPFIEIVGDVSDEMELVQSQEELLTEIISFANSHKFIMSKQEEAKLDELKKKFTDIKSNKKLLYVNQDFELPLEFQMNRFIKPGEFDKVDNALESILLHFLNSEEGILLVIMEHNSSPDEVFGIVSMNKDWYPLPTEVIEGMYQGILQISDNKKTNFVALTLNK